MQPWHCLTRQYIECLVMNLLVRKMYVRMDLLFRKPLILELKARLIEQVVSVKQINHALWAWEERAYLHSDLERRREVWTGPENRRLV